MPKNRPIVLVQANQDAVQRKIYIIRGKKVMLDADLAALYGVKTKALNLAVRRNTARFPDDFMFQLTAKEVGSLRFQIETSKKGRGGRRSLPYAFTQEGVATLSGVLNSPRAIEANILIMRTFAKVRELIATNELIRQKIEELEKKYKKHDKQFQIVFEAIREFLRTPEKPKRQIGFHVS